MVTSRMFDYAHFLPGFNYEIEYINTENHGNAEYLFRCTTSSVPWQLGCYWTIHDSSIWNHDGYTKKHKTETSKNPEIKLLLQILMNGKNLENLV